MCLYSTFCEQFAGSLRVDFRFSNMLFSKYRTPICFALPNSFYGSVQQPGTPAYDRCAANSKLSEYTI